MLFVVSFFIDAVSIAILICEPVASIFFVTILLLRRIIRLQKKSALESI